MSICSGVTDFSLGAFGYERCEWWELRWDRGGGVFGRSVWSLTDLRLWTEPNLLSALDDDYRRKDLAASSSFTILEALVLLELATGVLGLLSSSL